MVPTKPKLGNPSIIIGFLGIFFRIIFNSFTSFDYDDFIYHIDTI
jgi:hypothetical protein